MLQKYIEKSLLYLRRSLYSCKKTFKDERGVSLLQTMIALGLVSVVSVGLLRTQETAVRVQKNSENATDINLWMNRLTQNLFESQGCTNTMASLGSVSVGTRISEIRNRANRAIVNTTSGSFSIGKETRIRGFEITSYEAAPIVAPATTSAADIILRVEFEKETPKGDDWVTIFKEIPLTAAVDSSDRIQVCYDADSGIIDTALEQACETMDFNNDGVYDFSWDRNLRKCFPINHHCIDGGSYIEQNSSVGSLGTEGINPTTGTRSCPATFTAYELGRHVNLREKTVSRSTSKERNHVHSYNTTTIEQGYHQIYICLKCTTP